MPCSTGAATAVRTPRDSIASNQCSIIGGVRLWPLQEPLATQRAHACVVDRFLHKPSQPEMHEHGAVIAPLGATPFVYTDSAYFMDRDTAKLLLGVCMGRFLTERGRLHKP